MPVHRKAENRVRTKLLFRDPELNVDGKAAQQAENLQPRTRPRIGAAPKIRVAISKATS